MSTRILVRLALLAAFVVTATLSWFAIWRPAVMMRQVGLHGLFPESGRRCEDPVGMIWRHCYSIPPQLAPNVDGEETVSLDRRTRRITQLTRDWRAADSTHWSAQLDSVARALEHRGGERIECPAPSTSSEARSVVAWRFREQDVRLIAYTMNDAARRQPAWRIQVSGFPVGQSGCQAWVKGWRWLTLGELMEKAQLWIIGPAE